MHILSIETSCDETAIALVGAKGGISNPHFKISKSLVASQIKIHRPYGGVVPSLAKREHLKNLPILMGKILKISNFSRSARSRPAGQFLISKQIPNHKFQILNSVDLIAVTVGPGLEPALWVGINFAKEIYKKSQTFNSDIKIIGVSHLDAHLYSNLLSSKSSILYPAIGLIISGGHTILLLLEGLTHYRKLGETRDDAMGECFDKVARLLGLPYPGGPEIEKMAKYGSSTAIDFPRPMINQKNFDFSFSGLKTAVFYYLRDHRNVKIEDVAASFQAAAFETVINKTLRAAKEFGAKSILLSGGVASNISLRNYFKLKTSISGSPAIIIPPKNFCTDNAAMVAAAGYINYLRNKSYRLIAQGNLSLK